MRSLLLLYVLLAAGTLSAQVYTQNEMPVQQAKLPADCYTTNLDKGNAALRRGEIKEALRYFNVARECDEVQSNSRRLSELDNKIARAEEQLGIRSIAKSAGQEITPVIQPERRRNFSSELPTTRKNYKANPLLLRDTLEDCFQRMNEEADRAFRLRFWEDAAALYRAAKNCADADQAGRQLMSEKIVQCRNAAENELFAKQQEAERQARHAIAANLADDAQELLESSDRSLAFRLADFANQYIAPDDNPDCVQAIFDAWYYQPDEASRKRYDPLFNPLFCYEIAENYGNKVQLKFSQNTAGKNRLWTFSPEAEEITVRELPEMHVAQTLNTGDLGVFRHFDISAQEDILLAGDNYLELRRGARQHRINFSNITHWCFSPRGDELFFENSKELKIYALNVNQAFSQMASRKGAKNSNFMAPPVEPREIVSGIDPGLLALKYYAGKFWLGFSDRIEILSKSEAGKQWKKETIWHNSVTIPESFEQKHLNLALYPEQGFAVLVYFNQTWVLPLKERGNEPDSLFQRTLGYQNLIPLAICPKTNQIACKDTLQHNHDGFWILDVRSGDTLTHQHLPLYGQFNGMSGTFSSDGAWVAVVNDGIINLWALRDAPTKSAKTLPFVPEDKPLFSPDGSKVFLQYEDTVSILSTEDLSTIQTGKNLGTPLRGASNHWVMVQVNGDSVEARHIVDGKKIRFPLFNPGAYPFLYAVDRSEEKWVAYLSQWDKVEVRSLQTGALIADKKFEGGNISELQFIPGSNELLLVLNAETGTSSVKIWSPFSPQKTPRTMRLHQYSINAITIDPNGRRVALSNENDIRIFDMQNIENEALKIRSNKSGFISTLAFQPNSDLLAAAYLDGNVIFWDVKNGQPALQLQAVETRNTWGGATIPTAIGFAENGDRLILTIANGQILTYALDPSYIREVVQNDSRQLQAFSVDQIQEYNLESALYYPGNFERLASSNDAPLIRAFFQHFGNQAVNSNNIVQVRDYCEKALFLYERLNTKTQAKWINEMVFMYQDYAWKLLLRGNIGESKAVIQFIQRKFNQHPKLLLAHIALLQGECLKAGQQYTQQFLGDGSGLQDTYEIRNEMEQAEKELIQLRDYGLLDSSQLTCFCSYMSLSGAFINICPTELNVSVSLYEADMLRWEIYKRSQEALFTYSFLPKQKLLEEALQQSRKLLSINPAIGQGWVENTLLDLAKTYHAWAGFEQNSPAAILHFNSCQKLLTDYGSFSVLPDTTRLSLLATNSLACGKLLFNAGKWDDAISQFNGGLEAMNKLWPMVYSADSMLLARYSDFVVGPLYEKMGTSYLMLGDTANARLAYEKAGVYMYTYGLNTLYMGGLSAFKGDEIQALADYGGIFTANQTAEAFFTLDQLANRFPDRRENIRAIRQQVFTALQTRNPRLVNAEADYWYGLRKQISFAAQNQWDSTLFWSRQILKSAKICMDLPKSDEIWIQYWLDAQISVAYYQLMAEWNKPESLDAAITISNAAESYLNDHTNYYYLNRELIKTNIANALILRNKPGDRENALNLYRQFLLQNSSLEGYDNLDLLEKDIRDLKAAGAPWPALPSFQQIQDR